MLVPPLHSFISRKNLSICYNIIKKGDVCVKTILVGNGFNIELGGVEYLNKAIINRFLENIKIKDYSSSLYDHTITNEELAGLLPGLHDELKEIIKGQYDKYCTNDDKKLISLLKGRYSPSVKIDEVGMEDYFVILRLFHIRFNDDDTLIKSTHDGFCWQFLDAIYNEGKIQKIADRVLPAYRDYLKKVFEQYDNIYTVNYDKTVELIADKPINYLHGNFETLLDQYNSDTLIGFYYHEEGVRNPVTDDKKHIYCNALMGFSGSYKEKVMITMENGQFGVESILRMYEEGMSIQDMKKIERLKNSTNKGEQLAFGIINAKIKNPKLNMHQYPMKAFKAIKGEIHLLGISPFNDEHIWNVIIENPDITNIVYYYHDDKAKKELESRYSDIRFHYSPDTEFWGGIKE